MPNSQSLTEQRLRRAAHRKGLALAVSRQRPLYVQQPPEIWLVDPSTRSVVAGPFWRYDDVTEELASR